MKVLKQKITSILFHVTNQLYVKNHHCLKYQSAEIITCFIKMGNFSLKLDDSYLEFACNNSAS